MELSEQDELNSLAEQVDLEKYPPVCVEPDDQSESGSSDQIIIGHQVIGEQHKNTKKARPKTHLKGWILLYIIHNHSSILFNVLPYSSMFFSVLQYVQWFQ